MVIGYTMYTYIKLLIVNFIKKEQWLTGCNYILL